MEGIVKKINNGEIDINNQQNFFSTILKGLLIKLNEDVSLRDIPVPHFILHTGDDTLYIENKYEYYNASALETTSENYIYNTIPRCIVTPGGINFEIDQLTSSHALGQMQFEYQGFIYNLTGEFRRLPTKVGIELTYYTDTYNDMLWLIQQIATKLSFIRTYKVVYMGQVITCSYQIPESFSGEYMTEMDGSTEDNRNRKINLSIEVECNLPIWNCESITDSSKYINGFGNSNGLGLHLYPREGIKVNAPHETIEWSFETGEGN
jgi:hypothetical protein